MLVAAQTSKGVLHIGLLRLLLSFKDEMQKVQSLKVYLSTFTCSSKNTTLSVTEVAAYIPFLGHRKEKTK